MTISRKQQAATISFQVPVIREQENIIINNLYNGISSYYWCDYDNRTNLIKKLNEFMAKFPRGKNINKYMTFERETYNACYHLKQFFS